MAVEEPWYRSREDFFTLKIILRQAVVETIGLRRRILRFLDLTAKAVAKTETNLQSLFALPAYVVPDGTNRVKDLQHQLRNASPSWVDDGYVELLDRRGRKGIFLTDIGTSTQRSWEVVEFFIVTRGSSYAGTVGCDQVDLRVVISYILGGPGEHSPGITL